MEIPVGVFSQPSFMITKDLHSIAIKSLRQGQSLRDHSDASGVIYVLNPKFQALIPPLLNTASPHGPRTFKLFIAGAAQSVVLSAMRLGNEAMKSTDAP